MANPYKVQIDEDIEPIIPQFFENLQKDIISVEDALREQDSDKIAKLGHKAKGSSGSYGFTHLQQLFHDIEKAGKAQDTASASTIITDIKDYLAQLEIEYVEIE